MAASRQMVAACDAMRVGVMLLDLTLLAGLPAAACAQPEPARTSTTASATAPARVSRLVDAIADSLVAGYIYEATGRRIADSLRAALASGAYTGLADDEAVARRLNGDLRRLS